MNTSDQYAYCGIFTDQWNHPPKPFNPEYSPQAKEWYAQVTASMEADNYYATHTREECRAEWARRYAVKKGGGS